ncbi:MAG TPA: DNRLRE domain-containing protein [Polyangiaceae bacterium]|nr:DNRLRE domain-containing protein [Polyangiaceae bacterium]
MRAALAFRALAVAAMLASACSARRSTDRAATPTSYATRIVLAPDAIAVVSPLGAGGALPEEIPLGRDAVVLLLHFKPTWDLAYIMAAFLTLDPHPDAPPQGAASTVSVARVLEPWSPAEVTYARLPKLSAPEVRADVTTVIDAPLRVDVTAIVRRWARERPSDHGLAIFAVSESGAGATYATGLTGARGPRLDVYIR